MYKIFPPIDRERYTEIPGLEGPFQLASGKVVYYDPIEGKYWDRDTDFYLSDQEYFEHQQYTYDDSRESYNQVTISRATNNKAQSRINHKLTGN